MFVTTGKVIIFKGGEEWLLDDGKEKCPLWAGTRGKEASLLLQKEEPGPC